MYKSGDFNPRSPCGERRVLADFIIKPAVFQSTLSLRRATLEMVMERLEALFQSTLSLRRATDVPERRRQDVQDFNPRSPCGERPLSPDPRVAGRKHFNPRSPCGERHVDEQPQAANGDFNPRSPCGERLSPVTSRGGHMIFQSTLSLRRATAPGNRKPCAMVDFNPRSPCGERRRQRRTIQCRFRISIHALLAESDPSFLL